MSDFGESIFDDSSEQDDSSCDGFSASVITSSASLQGGRSHPTRRTTTSRPSSSATGRTSSTSNSITHVSLSESTGSELHCSSSTYSVLGSCPGSSAPGPGQAGDHASSTSWTHIDPVPGVFAQNTPPASPPRQASWPSSSCSSETSGSDEVDSISGESEPGRPPAETPGTSDASPEDNVFIFEQNPENQVVVIPPEELFKDLALPDESTLFPLTSDYNYDYITEAAENILERAKDNTSPWALSGDDGYYPELESCICAPPPGLGYREFFSKAREDRQKHERKALKKARSARQNRVGASPPDGRVSEVSDYTDHILSSVYTHSRSNYYDDVEEFSRQDSQQYHICPGLGSSKFSAETLTNLLYPEPTYAHLSPRAADSFATDLVAGIEYDSECEIDLSLGFGATLKYYIQAFIPKNREDLQTVRKLAGEETLEIQESLPITLALFHPEVEANEINKWLEGIIDSPSELRDYLASIQRRRKGRDIFVQLLDCIIGWHLASKNNLSDPARTTSRAALKLLMTTTLLTLVPKVKGVPEPLSQYISPQPSPLNRAYVSLIAPKLVNRQIKTSIHYLQQQLVCSLFCYLECPLGLDPEVKVVIALLIAFVLELGRKTSRQFAKFASSIDSRVTVTQQQVDQYEANINTQVFGRLRNSVRNTAGNLGDFGEKLREMGLDLKGKSKEGDEHNDHESPFVSAIFLDVL